MWDTGRGVPQDDAEAVRWYRLAADQGYAEAQVHLGRMYSNGRGVPEDDAEGVRWLRRAAEQGHAAAQLSLGRLYDDGWGGLPQDDSAAVRWYRLAADQGHAAAQSSLAIMYQNGEGVPQDHVQAHLWYNLAASRMAGGHRQHAVDGRDRAAGQMNPTRIAEAQRLAREWDAAHPSNPAQAQTPENDAVRVRAEAGDADAQYDLGVRYGTGQGIPQDYVLAHM